MAMISGIATTGSKLRLNSYLTNHNIEGFAIKNSRERYLIPSSDNIFGGVKIEYVFIDSGSNSSLFPLPTTSNKTFDIDVLLNNFPYKIYQWSIGTAHSVGFLPDTTLSIKPKVSNDPSLRTIKCCLHSDIKPLQFELPYIRFALDKEAIMVLVETKDIPFVDPDKDILEDALNFFNQFEKHFPLITRTSKHEYCLLGQHFLSNLCTIQINSVMIFVDKNKSHQRLFPRENMNMNDIADYLYAQRPLFTRTETFMLYKDDEHGERDLLNISGGIIDIDWEFGNILGDSLECS
ncbi:unnamed protein product [Didymodactylos carnosus]|uniref:Uncharacterized protein n=1 Tax=Didymodactylos carnosus TaxID=1234261 RepID=A0A815AWV4_9BILA|nr:unnamed protein product [Didymodactylos carnosus]CAF1483336.1 unnamed protein product [Didymodactylos carnosus]CAF4044510.1 unnamed protein product [Didymodactylos carnosus]CAF4273504.1 unnamed protein product [Didymodactylos carnosus]